MNDISKEREENGWRDYIETRKLPDLSLTKFDFSPYVCPICGKKIARPTTHPGSAKGLLYCHFKYKHDLFWRSFRPLANT